MEKKLTGFVYINTILLAVLAFYFFFYPALIIIRDLNDPGLRSGDAPPRFAYSWHRSLSPKYEKWARERVASGDAAAISIYDISGTEWPIFGTDHSKFVERAIRAFQGDAVDELTGLPTYIADSVYFGILFYLVCGGLLTWRAIFIFRRWNKSQGNPIPQPKLQVFLWIALFVSGAVMLVFFNKAIGASLIFLMQTLPTRSRIWSWLRDYETLSQNNG